MENASQHSESSKKISSFFKKEKATKVAVFGSYAKGEEKPESDTDILVEFSENKGLLTMVRIERVVRVSWSKSGLTYQGVNKSVPH